MLVGATVSLFAVDLETLTRAYSEQPLGALDSGRAATALLHPALAAADRAAPVTGARVPAAEARALFDALIEDRATARLYDAPFSALAEVFAALARAVHDRALELASLEAAPSAYPPELRPRDAAGGLVAWQRDPDRLAAAASSAAELVDGAPARGVDPELWRDLAAAVAEVCRAAARPGMVLVGESPS